MSNKGKIQLTMVMEATPELAVEGDRIFEDHAKWMERTHHRDGDKALITYNVSKSPVLTNPLDPTSDPTGNTAFILSEIYETEAGIADHFKQAEAGWGEFSNFMKWVGDCKSTVVPSAPINYSLWD